MKRTPIKPAAPGDADPHAQTSGLLPWMANGTLAGDERARVEAHLAACPACRERLAWEKKLRDAGSPPPRLSSGDAFARLQPRLGPQ